MTIELEETHENVPCKSSLLLKDEKIERREKWLLQVDVEGLEDLLLWKNSVQSAKVAGIGGYALICIRHLVNGNYLTQTHISPRVICFKAVRPKRGFATFPTE